MKIMGGSGMVRGTDENDTLWGLDTDDTLYGMGGDDLLEGGAGADEINGGPGMDIASYKSSSGAVYVDLAGTLDRTDRDAPHIFGGDAEGDTLNGIESVYGSMDNGDTIKGNGSKNLLVGFGGDDNIDGRGGNDILAGGSGADTLMGGSGQDLLMGGMDSDTLMGGSGHDTIKGGDGEDEVKGDDGDDLLSGEMGADMLMGGKGNDDMWGGEGDDSLTGGAGNDTLAGGIGADTLDGGEGNDVAWYTMSAEGVEVDLEKKTAMKGDAEGDMLENIEMVRGSHMDDKLTGKTYKNDADEVMASKGSTLYGNMGNDTLMGGMGADKLGGGKGNDELKGMAGMDTLVGGMGDDKLEGGDESGKEDGDELKGGDGMDTLMGGMGADTLIGGMGKDTLNGGTSTYQSAGMDTTDSTDDDVFMQHMDWADYSGSMEAIKIDLDASGQKKMLSGGDAEGDKVEGENSIEAWKGSDHDDNLSGDMTRYSDEDRTTTADNGVYRADGVTFSGGKGNDTIEGGSGADSLMGGAGDDTFKSTGGVSSTTANQSTNDTIDGGDGIDTVEYKGLANNVGATVNLGDEEGHAGVDNPTAQEVLKNIENVIGNNDSTAANNITGSDKANMLTGGDGTDTLMGGKGNDTLDGGKGNDGTWTTDDLSATPTVGLSGGDGDDMIMAGEGNDVIDGGKGDDMIYPGKGSDRVAGGTGADTIMLAADGTAGRITYISDFKVGSDKIDVSMLTDLSSEELETLLENTERTTVSGSITAGYMFTINLAEDGYDGGSLVVGTGRSTDLSVDDFIFA